MSFICSLINPLLNKSFAVSIVSGKLGPAPPVWVDYRMVSLA